MFLSGCGAGLLPPQTATSTATGTEIFTITAFDPPSGSVVASGSTVNVTFSEGQLDQLTVNVATYFNLTCNGVALPAANIIYSTGSSMAAITLPSTSGMASGTSCNFIVSPNLKDLNGVHLGGKRYATYFLP